MRILLITILFVFANKLHAQFYNCGGTYKEKTTELNYTSIDTQQVKKINLYLPLMDFRFYKKFYCFYAFEGKFKDFEDRTKDSCIIENPKLALKTYQDLNKIITKRLSRYVEISQPKFSYWDSVIVRAELRKIKFHFADSDSLYTDTSISPELFNVLKQYPASEHVFIDYFNKTAARSFSCSVHTHLGELISVVQDASPGHFPENSSPFFYIFACLCYRPLTSRFFILSFCQKRKSVKRSQA